MSADRDEMIAILERNLPGIPMRAEFQWRHEDNPAGPGWSWVVCDRNSGRIGAMTSLFPRAIYLNGKLTVCGQVGEFVVDQGYRSLGPAVMLQRATFQPVDSGSVSLCYDCPPHDQGMSTFIRLGMRPSCELTRYAVLLRGDEVLGKRLGTRVFSKPLITSTNLLLNARLRNRDVPGIEIQHFDASFGEEFTHLDSVVACPDTIRASRSAEILNWRYRGRPQVKVDVLTARRNGELAAFLALIVYENHGHKRASICDLFGRDLEETGLALLSAAIEACRRKNVVCLEGHSSETSDLKPIFLAAGFRPREIAARIVAYAKPGILKSQEPWPVGQAELVA
jgi:hypothetical protein